MTRSIILFIFALSARLFTQELGDVSSSLPLQQVLVGEEALLNIQIYGEQPSSPLKSTEASPLSFRTLQPDILGRREVFSANLGVSSATTGTFTVPSFTVPLKSGDKTTRTFTMEVFPTDGLTWQNLRIGDQTYKIGSTLLHPRGTIYAGQSIPLTAKVLVPVALPVGSTGFAEIEKENIGAWRMEAPLPPNYDQQVSPRSPNAIQPREVRIDGERYHAINYVTFAAPLKDGAVKVGPGKIQGLQVQVTTRTNQARGFFGSFSRSYNLELDLPEVTFSATALPKGAPADFQGAVGDFTLEAALDVTSELKPGDPVMLSLTVSGEGNLDTLAPPVLDAPESNWKIYPSSRNEKDGARRTNQGTVVFTQILRPRVPIKEVPAFTLPFFNPKTAKYETLRSAPIPLNLSPVVSQSAGVPQAGLVPIAEMQDILGLIEPQPFRSKDGIQLGLWWQIFPAAIVAVLAFLLIKRQLPRLQSNNPEKTRLHTELKELEELGTPSEFLRAAAHLAESHGLAGDEFVADLIEERDRFCFQPGEQPGKLENSRRQEILKNLREKLSLGIMLLTLFLVWQPTTAEAFHDKAQAAWDEGNYQEALDAYQLSLKDEKTPDLLYNIANCYYRLDQPGKAALFYRRALELNPSHPESLQNLAFLERKMGAIPTPESDLPAWSKKLTTPLLTNLLLGLVWLFLIAVLIRFVLRSSRVQQLSTLTMIGTGLMGILFGVLLFFHPGKEEIVELDTVLISDEPTEVRTEPSSGGSEILNANPSTACRVLTQRGNWSYIELPNQTRGWIESDALEPIAFPENQS
ncbi:tetratricopeptide repeat protein [Roseibacillus persicicus]|uniref:Tetratricopeptide repeat protein n=1 Tax=Roseibacillus persicicus TaxID=454148 RepID=A0A918WNB8_9BACT|nr:tetratricopeptide repeat protein [Roseibacillus persicicus]GHC59270.1 hypothetical protein GCM10007100_27990 [Roseibacillus persicicus]